MFIVTERRLFYSKILFSTIQNFDLVTNVCVCVSVHSLGVLPPIVTLLTDNNLLNSTSKRKYKYFFFNCSKFSLFVNSTTTTTNTHFIQLPFLPISCHLNDRLVYRAGERPAGYPITLLDIPAVSLDILIHVLDPY